ncbi:MAG: helix-turn-helix domain-containing protein [Bacteroidota bacterium]
MRIQLTGVNPLPYHLAKTDEKLMNRLQVQDYLDISRTTYNRKVKEGKLKPMRLPGGHKYYKHDLLTEYNESKRRGRI